MSIPPPLSGVIAYILSNVDHLTEKYRKDGELVFDKIIEQLKAINPQLFPAPPAAKKKTYPSKNHHDEIVTILCENAGFTPDWENHQRMMTMENKGGDTLEAFILQNTDFINVDKVLSDVDFWDDHTQTLIQIKNGTTTENAAGSSVRNGTLIKKWARRNPKTNQSYWDQFPYKERFPALSHEAYCAYVRSLAPTTLPR